MLSVALGWMVTGASAAQTSPPSRPPTAPAPPPPTPTAQPSLDSVRVVRVVRLVSDSAGSPQAWTDAGPMTERDSVRVSMGDIIGVQVWDLESLVLRSECRRRDGSKAADCTTRKILLYLDGRAITDLVPESGAPRPGGKFGTLQFHLARTPTSDEAWADLLGGPSIRDPFYRPMELSVGLEGEHPVDTEVRGRRFIFVRIRPLWFAAATFLLPLLAIGFVWYARASDGLRDLGPQPAAGRKPYSLGRCQMAWWLFLVVGAFCYIYAVTNSANTITDSILALMGISAGTLLGAAAIDAGDMAAKAAANVAVVTPPSRGFLQDILSDARGQSFHRLQMMIWTLVLGAIFFIQVWSRLAMPTFDATLLGLLGISSGTYLGFKFPER